jgi:hypothetical protein
MKKKFQVPWFKVFVDDLNSGRLQYIAQKSGEKFSTILAIYMYVLNSAHNTSDVTFWGTLKKFDPIGTAVKLGISIDKMENISKYLEEFLIDPIDKKIVNWRQTTRKTEKSTKKGGMSMPWFKVFADDLNDIELTAVIKKSKKSTTAVIGVYLYVLKTVFLAIRENENTIRDFNIESVALRLQESEQDIIEILDAMRGIILQKDGVTIKHWLQ